MELIQNLNLVNSWLKHAESKHAVFIGFTSAITGLVIDSFIRFELYNFHFGVICAIWAVVCLIIAITISLYSFLPILKEPKIKNKENPTSEYNPYFFKDAASLTSDELLSLLNYEDKKTKQDYWLAEQIIINSKITLIKFRLFKYALWISFFGLLPLIAFIVLILRTFYKRT